MSLLHCTRRTVVAGTAALAGLWAGCGNSAQSGHGAAPAMTPDEALALLKQGNELFVADQSSRTPNSRERRLEIAKGQHPFAVLVGCSDSRVAPELLFGRGLGELFVVRDAGNTVDTRGMGSIEYAVAELKVPLIVVLGHERCGAVAAAVGVVQDNTTYPGSIGPMIEPIVPAVLRAKAELTDGSKEALVDAAVYANVSRVVTQLRTSQAVLLEPLSASKLKVVGARYDLEDGRVDFFDEG
jgi:carbonic anhydrase